MAASISSSSTLSSEAEQASPDPFPLESASIPRLSLKQFLKENPQKSTFSPKQFSMIKIHLDLKDGFNVRIPSENETTFPPP